MIETLQHWDAALLLKLNSFHNPFWDQVMSVATGRFIWVPLYVFLFVFLLLRFRKKMLILVPTIALLILCADQTSRVFKYACKRDRPCYNVEIMDELNVPDGCGGQYGFVSSHAANTFGLAMFIFLLWKGRRGRGWWLLLFVWAGFVSYTRIYLGVHYPLDIACGALVGIAAAFLVHWMYRRWLEGLVKS